MNDLEDRLRTRLRDLADEVPPSQHPRADLDRRLAGRRTKRSTLAVAAAAVVVLAGVAIPVAINRGGDDPGGRRAATSTSPTTLTPATGTKDTARSIGEFTENGVRKRVVLDVSVDKFCFMEVVPEGAAVSRPGDCLRMPTWPQPESPSLVQTRSVFNDGTIHGGPLPNRLVFVTAPNVETLEVSAGNGEPVTVRLLVRATEATFFVAEFPETHAGFGYTARDKVGNILESAIT